MHYHIPLKDYPENLKPRERLQENGVEALADLELLAILLGTGTQGQTALDLARQLLLELPRGDLAELGQQNLKELCRLSGLGPAKAARILAGLELGRRVSRAEAPQREKLDSPEAVYRLLASQLEHQKQEHFLALYVDTKNRLLGRKVISSGILNGTLIHPREIFREALIQGAYALLAVHNHPSGDPEPSPDDLETTRRLIHCGKLMQIELLDHIIIGRRAFSSLRERESWLWKQYDILE